MTNKFITGGALGTQLPKLTNKTLAELTSGSVPKSGGSGYYVPASGPKQTDEEVITGYLDTMYAAYKPDPLVYEEKSEEELRTQIEAWLRPSYDKAILLRQKRTQVYRAELDADAISRGMGASSYVTDVKNRQMTEEAEDITALESEYGATLAKTLSEQLAAERERALAVAMQNKQNDYDAYMRAYSAALVMFETYKANGGGVTGGYYVSTGSGVVATSKENCEAFLATISPEERQEVYSGSTAQGQRYKNEILASVGLSGYYELRGKYRTN